MRLRLEQLEGALNTIAPVYFISGDEPLQLGEAADAIRKAAKLADYSSREVLSVETGFEWNELLVAAGTLSIFADKKLIDLRIPSGKPGTEGAKVLTNYCQRLPEDTVLLITAPKLAKSSMKSKWVQSIDQVGVVLQVWPLEGKALLDWLQRRALKRGLQISASGLKVLAAQVEGNLLAASQEIEKLYILYGDKTISTEDVQQAVADNARFDVFTLTDCVLAGRASRAVKILNGLKAEGIAAPVVLWALAREVRMIINIKRALKQGQNKDNVFRNHQLWDKRKQLVNNMLTRTDATDLNKALLLGAKADRQIKGQELGDCWETLLSICLLFHASR